MKPPELNPEPEESLPSRRSPEGPDPPVLTEVPPPNDYPLDLESVKKKMEMGRYSAVVRTGAPTGGGATRALTPAEN